MKNLPFPCLLPLIASAGIASATILAVPVNITTGSGSSATQSTTLGAPYAASSAIDGTTGTFTHTNPPEAGNGPAWWEVNLGTDRSISDLRIMNRADCCGGRLRDLTVEVRDASNVVLFVQSGINAANILNGPSFLNVATGLLNTARFIRITRTPIAGQEITHDGSVLSISELIATNSTNVLLPTGSNLTHSNIAAMNVSQSTTLSSFSAGNAVNGLVSDFTHTLGTDNTPSWTVDFGEVMNLESFSIDNRTSCCQGRLRDITVTVKDSLNATVFTSALLNPANILNNPATLSGLFPSGLTGRYVTISRTPDLSLTGDDRSVLSLAEVNIFGSSIPEPSAAMLGLLALGASVRRRR